MEEVKIEQFIKVVLKAEQSGKIFPLQLSPLEITGLHGAIVLAMKHPDMIDKLQDEYQMLQRIRQKLCQMMVDIGFTEEEVEWLDRTEI